jgi:hypothetical protein
VGVRRPKARRRRQPSQDPHDGLFESVDVGGQRIRVVGYTAGDMPYGVTEDEYDAPNRDDEPA